MSERSPNVASTRRGSPVTGKAFSIRLGGGFGVSTFTEAAGVGVGVSDTRGLGVGTSGTGEDGLGARIAGGDGAAVGFFLWGEGLRVGVAEGDGVGVADTQGIGVGFFFL
jgi:hypothetical protein